jgi:LAGLIDADG-like domain
VRTISREVAETSSLTSSLTPQRLHAELLAASASGARAYLHGAAHDATISQRHRTVRFGQSDVRWLEALRILVEKLGLRSWIYREGRTRNLWILETSAAVLADVDFRSSTESRRAYARGYFDADGGCPRTPLARFYIQFVQKNRADIEELWNLLMREGIECGRIHNPSRRRDPNLWRFYVAAHDHETFAWQVGSWHPRKRGLLEARFGFERRG